MKKGPVGKPDLYFSINERMGSELDLHTRGDRRNDIAAEAIASLIAARRGADVAAASAADRGFT